MKTWRNQLFTKFGPYDCSITREQAKEAAAYITALVFFMTLGEIERRGLPLHPDTPLRQLVRVVPASL